MHKATLGQTVFKSSCLTLSLLYRCLSWVCHWVPVNQGNFSTFKLFKKRQAGKHNVIQQMALYTQEFSAESDRCMMNPTTTARISSYFKMQVKGYVDKIPTDPFKIYTTDYLEYSVSHFESYQAYTDAHTYCKYEQIYHW